MWVAITVNITHSVMGDPHSPRDGGLWSHMLWLFLCIRGLDARQALAPDLAKDSGVLFFHKTFLFGILGSLWVGAGAGQFTAPRLEFMVALGAYCSNGLRVS